MSKLEAKKRAGGTHTQGEQLEFNADSHGTDVEHFWPKTPYPERMFVWLNLLLCCAECGRFKGALFPLVDGTPLLVDPTAEDPWQHLDFDPTTGNIVAKYNVDQNGYSIKGVETVKRSRSAYLVFSRLRSERSSSNA